MSASEIEAVGDTIDAASGGETRYTVDGTVDGTVRGTFELLVFAGVDGMVRFAVGGTVHTALKEDLG